LPNRLPACGKQQRARLRRDGIAGGELAKCWQYGAAVFKYKAGQPQAVTRGALQAHRRLGVPCQNGMAGMRLSRRVPLFQIENSGGALALEKDSATRGADGAAACDRWHEPRLDMATYFFWRYLRSAAI
jgi:hypothetical protein